MVWANEEKILAEQLEIMPALHRALNEEALPGMMGVTVAYRAI